MLLLWGTPAGAASDGKNHFRLIPPLYYHGWNANGKDTVVLGTYVRRRDARRQSETELLLPLFGRHAEPGYQVQVGFPFYWRVHDGAEADLVLFPLYWRQRSPDLRTDVLFPLLWRVSSRAATTTVVGPVYRRDRNDGGRAFGLLPLFAYSRSAGGRSRYLIAPLLLSTRNQDADSSRFILGPLFHFHRPGGFTDGLVPLAFAWGRGTSTKVVSPIYYHQSNAAQSTRFDVLGPLYYGRSSDSRAAGLAPLLFWRSSPAFTSALLLPLFYYNHRREGSTLLTPLAGYSTNGDGRRFYLGTFYRLREPGYSATGLLPLVYVSNHPASGTGTTLAAPLYLHARLTEGRELSAYTPLVWRYHTVEGSWIFGLPVYFDFHAYDESRSTGVLPLFALQRNHVEHHTSLMLSPLLLWTRLRRGEDPGVDVVWLPLLWRFGGANSSTVIFPLAWDFVRGGSRTTLFPLGMYWRRSDAVHTLIGNVYYRRGLGPRLGSYYLDVFPILQLGRSADARQFGVLEGLVGVSRKGSSRTLRLLWLLEFEIGTPPQPTVSWFGSTPAASRTDLF